MVDTLTPVLGLVKPEINGEDTENVWGYDLNDNFDKIDDRFGGLPASDAPLDGNIYGRRMGVWQATVMATDLDTLSDRVDAVEEVNEAQDTTLAGKADMVHTHVAIDVIDLGETIDDRVAALLTAGPNMVVNYDDELGKITLASTGGGEGGGGGLVFPGDYGEITVSNDGFTWTIDPKVVTYAKIQDVAADKLLGAVTAGRVQEISCTAAGRALLDDADAAAQRTTLGLSSMATEDAANFQAKDATLTALANLNAAVGVVEQTGVDTFAKRPVSGGTAASLMTFSDTEGRYQRLDPTLTALSALPTALGVVEQIGVDVFQTRPIGAGAAHWLLDRYSGDVRYATIDSPIFTGDARCVTPAAGDNDTSIATTAFVKAQGYAGTASPLFQGMSVFNNDQSTANGPGGPTCIELRGAWEPSIAFHRPGVVAVKFGLNGANVLCIGGWSWPDSVVQITSAGNIHNTGGLYTVGVVSGGSLSTPGPLNANTVTANGITSNGNTHTAGTCSAGALSAPTVNCTNLAATNNVTCANGNVSGGFYVGGLQCYGNINSDTTITAGGNISTGATITGFDVTATNWVRAAHIECSGDTVSVGYSYAVSHVNTSDERLKEDLQPITDAQDILAATEVWNFRWIESGERDYGVIAQHAVNVLPTAVRHDAESDIWGVDYAKYVPILIAAVKELQAQIVELRGQLGR